jgi:hypothetical protein
LEDERRTILAEAKQLKAEAEKDRSQAAADKEKYATLRADLERRLSKLRELAI